MAALLFINYGNQVVVHVVKKAGIHVLTCTLEKSTKPEQ